MTVTRSIGLALLVAWLFRALSAQAEFGEAGNSTIVAITTDFPPYSFTHNGEVSGLSTEVVRAICREAGITLTSIKAYPWARTYATALHQKNTLIYSIARSPERESLFQWIGQIAPFRVYLYRLASRTDIRLNSLEDAHGYRIGGEINDIKQQYLVDQGFKPGSEIILEPEDELSIRMLFAGRTDLLPFNDYSLPDMLKREHHRPEELTRALYLKGISYPLYAAMSADTPPELVARLRQALDRLRQDGRLAAIQREYLASLQTDESP